MDAIVGWVRRIQRKPSWEPIQFSNSGFETLPIEEKFEEERIDDLSTGRYYPVQIGQILDSRYQVVGKLGYGLGSTVWLARDLQFVPAILVNCVVNRELGNVRLLPSKYSPMIFKIAKK